MKNVIWTEQNSFVILLLFIVHKWLVFGSHSLDFAVCGSNFFENCSDEDEYLPITVCRVEVENKNTTNR